MERDARVSPFVPVLKISTHTLTWSVTRVVTVCKLPFLFQLTRSRGAWLHLLRLNCKNLHFNSHAHVERDDFNGIYGKGTEISTHTLTWSVTLHIKLYHFLKIISTHTLTWSVTFSRYTWPLIGTISTHTLTWSVTRACTNNLTNIVFQLTRSRGAWRYFLII